MAALTPKERMDRAVAMLKWARDAIGRQILKEEPDCDAETLKWKVAARLYASDRRVVAMIERILERVSDRSL
ncbi:MAG TPA: hypothetical protein VMM56_03625 [Planctomycetaceae bacterium]|nr:hypothetical protein [Planctomycetaceae bacterium]